MSEDGEEYVKERGGDRVALMADESYTSAMLGIVLTRTARTATHLKKSFLLGTNLGACSGKGIQHFLSAEVYIKTMLE